MPGVLYVKQKRSEFITEFIMDFKTELITGRYLIFNDPDRAGFDAFWGCVANDIPEMGADG